MPLLKVGDHVPDVSFRTAERTDLPLTGFSGKQHIVLAFYARAFTGG